MVRKAFAVGLVAAMVLWVGNAFAEPPYLTAVKFDAFCRAYFTAPSEPEVWKTFGFDLKLVDEGAWKYVSQNSATIGFETSLPTRSYVLYGLVSNSYGYATPITDRSDFIHVHHLKYLLPNVTYYYREIVVDEIGRAIRGEEKAFATKALPNAVLIPGGLQGPPYVLDKPNTTYLLTKDIVCDATGLNIIADGVTLDLGGNKVTYNQTMGVADRSANEALYGPQGAGGPCGIRTADSKKNIRILNGTVEQGAGMGASEYNGYYPIFMRDPVDAEVAGVNLVYAGPQVTGIKVNKGGDGLDIHHNVIYDQGMVLKDRHRGVHAIDIYHMDNPRENVKGSKIHHNLILRTRHCGISANEKNDVYCNEIYIDSYATNSYGIEYTSLGASQKLDIHNNHIYGTGFHPIGIGAGQGWSDVSVHANYIQMQGTTFEWRWAGGTGGGDADAANKSGTYPVNGIRVDRPRQNVRTFDNVIVVKGFGLGCMMRGLWMQPDSQAGYSVNFSNNRIKVIAQDGLANGWAVVAGGIGFPAAKPHVMVEGNTVESNICNVQFGDHQGHGGPYVFTGNTLVRSFYDTRYVTVRMGWRGGNWDAVGDQFIDTKFEGGAGFDKVAWDGAKGRKYDFTVSWKLTVQADPGSKVTIKNKAGKAVFTGVTDAKGKAEATILQGTWAAEGVTSENPHTVIVEKGAAKVEKSNVTVDKSMTISLGI